MFKRLLSNKETRDISVSY